MTVRLVVLLQDNKPHRTQQDSTGQFIKLIGLSELIRFDWLIGL